jgi:hypothetical protein
MCFRIKSCMHYSCHISVAHTLDVSNTQSRPWSDDILMFWWSCGLSAVPTSWRPFPEAGSVQIRMTLPPQRTAVSELVLDLRENMRMCPYHSLTWLQGAPSLVSPPLPAAWWETLSRASVPSRGDGSRAEWYTYSLRFLITFLGKLTWSSQAIICTVFTTAVGPRFGWD